MDVCRDVFVSETREMSTNANREHKIILNISTRLFNKTILNENDKAQQPFQSHDNAE